MHGQGNCEKLAKFDTDELAEVFMKTMRERERFRESKYVRNLALVVSVEQ